MENAKIICGGGAARSATLCRDLLGLLLLLLMMSSAYYLQLFHDVRNTHAATMHRRTCWSS